MPDMPFNQTFSVPTAEGKEITAESPIKLDAKDKKGVRYCSVEEGQRLDQVGTQGWSRLVEHFRHPDYQTVLGFDAVSAHARGGSYSMTQPSYAEQCAMIRRDRWEKCRTLRLPSITFASTGWDTRPRNERPPSAPMAVRTRSASRRWRRSCVRCRSKQGHRSHETQTILTALSLALGAALALPAGAQEIPPRPEKWPSPVPRKVFPLDLAGQEKALETNRLMVRFAASRKELSADRHRPAYQFVSPESTLNDPNGLCFRQGRWHLFYQAYPPEDPRRHWGHTVSDDLVHWRDLPCAIYPGIERMCYSGSTVVEPHQVVAFYPGVEAGQMVAVSKDPLLLNWEKIRGNPVTRPGQPMGDSCIWRQEDAYYGLVGSRCLLTSTNVEEWRVCNGSFLEGFPLEDGSRPNFQPIGEKHILLFFSHDRGGQYLLGDYGQRYLAMRVYPGGQDSLGVSLRAQGQDAVLRRLDAWQMKSIYP